MTRDEWDERLEQHRERDNRAYAISYVVVAILRRFFFTFPIFEVFRHFTEVPWPAALGISLVLSFPLQALFRWWLDG